jgi:hypothetical protein
MSIVAPVGYGIAMGAQFPLAIPLLQGIGGSTDEFAELFRRIYVVHTYILLHLNMFINTV